jgi:cytoskeleton protein RodZ
VDAPAPADPPASDGPGARLRAARQAAGLSLDQVAQQLKLAPRQVKALEDEDFAQLPGRTFARGFVRNYARLLNLDGDALLALLPVAGTTPALDAPALQSTGTMIAELPVAAAARSGLSRWLIPILLVACVIGAAAYEWHRGKLAAPEEAARSAATAPESAGA